MIDVVKGQTDKVASSQQLAEFFSQNNELQGKVYIGYPILYSGGESIVIDALWISKKFGIIIFDLIEEPSISDRKSSRDVLYTKMRSLLMQYTELSKGRNFLVNIEVITFAPACNSTNGNDFTAIDNTGLLEIVESLDEWSNDNLYSKVISVIQTVTQLKANTDRNYVKKADSKGAIINALEKTIANLDNKQEEAIIEYHDGLQRIRGLAQGKRIKIGGKMSAEATFPAKTVCHGKYAESAQ